LSSFVLLKVIFLCTLYIHYIMTIPKSYYSSLETGEDLQTSAACPAPSRLLSPSAKTALQQVHPDVCKRFLGCGVVVPEKLKGCSILDLGSGSGRDCYMLSKLVGEDGHVTGIDMTSELVEASRKYIQYHQELFGYAKPNTVFLQGYMEKLGEAGIKDSSVDVIVYEGGELYFSDMYANKVVPDSFREDAVLWVDKWIFKNMSEGHKKQCDIKYASGTYRIFKLPKHSIRSKALVTYKGTVPDCEEHFAFDASYSFKTNLTMDVDAEMAAILQCTRFSSDFTVQMTDEPDPSLDPTRQVVVIHYSILLIFLNTFYLKLLKRPKSR
uniref:Arsenite methyltransferase n=1 Tax=Astyanax mexicanus TaxID=7994 RepID=A0A8B9GY12_ASTMX